ncbi:septum site-determining protein Ssd [Cellulomonas sp. McL0617]|uniref:septum site-determining protein Ssd n=1 Tax=Cellulomonas sp. McL0617 TaxID=3415675 RepID=UPI003CF90C84
MVAVVLGVVGARGGAGASTLAAALAGQLARRTATVLVDLDRGSGGIDVLLGLEGVDGVRWPDLRDARGDVPGADVVAVLPRWGSCAVLSADRSRSGAPEPAVVADVLHGLCAAVGAVVLDLDRSAVVAGESLVAVCDSVLVVAPRDLRSVAGVLAMRPFLGPDAGLVVRGPAPGGLGASEVAAAVGLPVVGSLRRDRRLPSALEHGGLEVRGRTARTAGRLARGVL